MNANPRIVNAKKNQYLNKKKKNDLIKKETETTALVSQILFSGVEMMFSVKLQIVIYSNSSSGIKKR